MDTYEVKTIYGTKKKFRAAVPGSKSITNRALLLAALADGETTLHGALFSNDTANLLSCLSSLGIRAEADEEKKTIRVEGCAGVLPRRKASVNVGSAGTAARFLTALLALAGGTYEVDASEQMRKRPMQPLLDALAGLGVRVTYHGEQGHFPFTLESEGVKGGTVSIDIGVSSQFLSALLMAGVLLPDGLTMELTGTRKSLPYVDMTAALMSSFGAEVTRPSAGSYRVEHQAYRALPVYPVEPDVSAAGYFFAMACILGTGVFVEGVHKDCLQGDIRFLSVLESLGCRVREVPDEILDGKLILGGTEVTGPEEGCYDGIDIDMNDFSDQTMTMAAVSVFAQTKTVIRGISHIRFQETDRMAAVAAEVQRLGLACEMTDDSLTIHPGTVKAAEIETYGDHRMAMAFALVGLRAQGIVIRDPGCCAKTFADYFSVLDSLIESCSEANTDEK